jgi:hypothetical protein
MFHGYPEITPSKLGAGLINEETPELLPCTQFA